MISRPELRWKTFWWMCDWAIMLGVIVGSLVPPEDLHRAIPDFNDKVMHCSAYFLMTMWFAGSLDPKKYTWLVVGMCLLGIPIEYLQYLMGFGRSADWRDVVANTVGVLTALALARAGLGNWMAWVERRFAPT